MYTKGDARTMEAFLYAYGIPVVEESVERVDGLVNFPDVSIHVQVADAEFSRAERIEQQFPEHRRPIVLSVPTLYLHCCPANLSVLL